MGLGLGGVLVHVIVFLLELAAALYALGFTVMAAGWVMRRSAPLLLRAWFWLCDRGLRRIELERHARHAQESHIDDLLHAIEAEASGAGGGSLDP